MDFIAIKIQALLRVSEHYRVTARLAMVEILVCDDSFHMSYRLRLARQLEKLTVPRFNILLDHVNKRSATTESYWMR